MLLLATGYAPALFAQSVPRIYVHVFLSAGCPYCESVERTALAKLSQKLGCEIAPAYHDVDSMEEYKRLVLLEKRYQKTGNDLPVAIIGPHLLGGNKEIEGRLEPTIRELIRSGESGEIALPEASDIAAAFPSGTRIETATIYAAYFEQPGCRQCRRAEHLINFYQSEQPALKVERFMATQRENKLLLEVLCEKAGVPEDQRLIVPAIFIGGDFLIRDQVTDANMTRLLEKYARTRSQKIWEVGDTELAAARERIYARFRGTGIAAVVAGGLVDGINPCAFATIIFFITYLAAIGKGKSQLLAAGCTFCAGVFAAYLAVGMGMSEVLLRFEMVPWIAVIMRWAIVTLLGVLTLLSLYDAWVAWRGEAQGMVLKIPHALRMRINLLITRKARAVYILPASFVLGAAVSMIELVCTGQVYLPLIQLMLSVSLERIQTLFLLVIYNLAFVLPLVCVFIAAFLGVRSEGLTGLLKRYIVPAKLLLACFFAALAAVMVLIAT